MKFDLVTKEELKKLEDFEFEIYEEDSLTEALSFVENSFYESKNITFKFNCLNEDWNVFIFGDFSVFTEQLLQVYNLCILNSEKEYLLDFYEQGVERKLMLSKIENTIKIENHSGENWISKIKYEIIETEQLKKDIISFVKKVKDFTNKIKPEINELKVLKKWYGKFETTET